MSVPGLFLSVLTGSTSIAGNDPFTPGAIPLYEDDTPKLTPLSSMKGWKDPKATESSAVQEYTWVATAEMSRLLADLLSRIYSHSTSHLYKHFIWQSD